jgi:hypothetical protein
VRTQGGWAKEIRGEGLSYAVVKIARTYMFCKRHGIECIDEHLFSYSGRTLLHDVDCYSL